MNIPPLCVFSLQRDALPLGALRDLLREAGYPAGIGVSIAGEATEEELTARNWEAAFLRWTEPEMHEIALLERATPGEDESADAAIADALTLVAAYPESAGRLIVADHLRRTQTIYLWEILPAMLDDADHPAWNALDIALRGLAAETDGLVYATEAGFYDADGELLLAEGDEVSIGWPDLDIDEDEEEF
jgi:hypothetical protein